MFAVTEQRLADQARQIRVNKWLTDVEIKERKRRCQTPNQVRRTDGGNDEGSIEEEKNDNGIVARTEGDRQTEGELQEVGEEEMNQSRNSEEGNRDIDQVHGTEVEGDRNFLEEEGRVLKRAEREGLNEEDKEVLKKLLHEIRNSPNKVQPNLRYMDRKKV